MWWVSLCADAGIAILGFWSALLAPPRDRSATVTDIREGHAIRTRRARRQEKRL